MPGKNVPQQNGFSTVGKMNFDPDDPEYIRAMQRPAVIMEDLNEMERRKRVHQILQSKSFVNQLEQLIVDEKKRGTHEDNLLGLERLTDLILPSDRSLGSASASPRSYGGSAGIHLAPIADLRGTGGTSKYSKQERLLRTKLASLFRLVDHFQWYQGTNNHTTLRISPDAGEILINPDGLSYRELSASSLAKVDLDGNILDHGQRGSNLVITNFALHLAVHAARPDIRCIMDLRDPVLVAVSAMHYGLLPISQEAMVVGPVSFHELAESGGVDSNTVAQDLGPRNKILLLRNHGFLICAPTIEEVFHLAFNLVLACQTQVRAVRAGLDNLCLPSEQARRQVYETTQIGGGGVNRTSTDKKDSIKWKVGELEWEAYMRVLDNAGHQTGHIYRQNLNLTRPPAAQSDVEVPPAACAYGLLDERTETDRVAQAFLEPKARWLNTPNLYQRVEFEETGTSKPKKLTKWVPDATSQGHSNPIKIESAHQFTPLTQDPKEFKLKQKAIKEARRADKISAGPQSKILGVTWEEAAKMKDAERSGTQEMIIIGAVSQGIIDPEYRHNAQVYRQLYQPNPFASVTDDEIQNYIRDVEIRGTAASSGLSDSSFEEVSLMQAVRGRERERERVSFTDERAGVTNTIADSTGGTPKQAITTSSPRQVPTAGHRVQASSIGGWFQRSKSDRFGMKKNGKEIQARQTLETIRGTASDEDTRKEPVHILEEKKEKKKRFKTPSFLRSKKDKESKKKADR